jgi:putative membrane protein
VLSGSGFRAASEVVRVFWDRYGMGWGWGWIWVILPLLLIVGAIVVLVILLTRTSAGSTHHPGASPPDHRFGPPPTPARTIVEERLARGEITPDEYREIVRALDETSRPPGT